MTGGASKLNLKQLVLLGVLLWLWCLFCNKEGGSVGADVVAAVAFAAWLRGLASVEGTADDSFFRLRGIMDEEEEAVTVREVGRIGSDSR